MWGTGRQEVFGSSLFCVGGPGRAAIAVGPQAESRPPWQPPFSACPRRWLPCICALRPDEPAAYAPLANSWPQARAHVAGWVPPATPVGLPTVNSEEANILLTFADHSLQCFSCLQCLHDSRVQSRVHFSIPRCHFHARILGFRSPGLFTCP